jgi:hypothetical protein
LAEPINGKVIHGLPRTAMKVLTKGSGAAKYHTGDCAYLGLEVALDLIAVRLGRS